ncbi:MAG TPA: DUF559 domain-containing protein [Solirubrobacteraceae bacterium]
MIARIAARQYGVVQRVQLLAQGLERDDLAYRVRVGRLHRIHRGVYAVGHTALTPLAHDLAAVLACGPGTVLSSFNAAVLWDLLKRQQGPIHVTTRRQRRAPAGVVVHQAPLPREDTTTRHAIPVTTPTRTILDLAAHAPTRDLENALAQAQVLRLINVDHLRERAQNRRGAAALRALLDDGPAFTRSEAERRLLQLIARAGLPKPRTNIWIAGHEVDTVWLSQKLVAEVDGFAFHAHRAAFERDRARDADLMAAGYRVLRFTWRQITRTPEAVAIRLANALA